MLKLSAIGVPSCEWRRSPEICDRRNVVGWQVAGIVGEAEIAMGQAPVSFLAAIAEIKRNPLLFVFCFLPLTLAAQLLNVSVGSSSEWLATDAAQDIFEIT